MLEKNDKKNIIVIGAVLFAITAIAALILAVVNSYTAPVIESNNKRNQDIAMKQVLPDADKFEKVEFDAKDGSVVTELYSAGDKGVVVKAAPKGYGGEISMVVGIDSDYKVTGIEIISQSETAGLGANCERDDFKKQFVGKTSDIKVVKGNAADNQIDAISSATITSKAVTKGVNEAIELVKQMRGGE